MRRIRRYISFVLAMLLIISSTGCGTEKGKEPVTITIWHVYGGQAESPLNDLIDVFNKTTGREQGIQVQVGSVSNTNTIHENVLSSAYGDPGADELPDMFLSYPKTVLAMPDDSVLVDYRDYFSEEEITEFIPAFVEEGTIDGRFLILPVAKSTEVLYINKTAFDRFHEATGAQLSELNTWEGLYNLAERYGEWTDSLTPETTGDGKIFFVHDYHFDYFQVGVESLGERFFQGNKVSFGPAFKEVWMPYAKAAIKGGVWLQSGYATEPLRTGDSIVSVASSASVLYYSDVVTYADNTTEKVEIIALPCPTFADGEKLVMQRGSGVCTVKSTPEREKACMVFLKWLTDAERNVEFVTKLGYMPVKQESFEQYLPKAVGELENPLYASLYQVFLEMQKSYTFYTAPQMDDYLTLETRFEEMIRQKLTEGRNSYQENPEALDELISETLDDFKESYEQ